MTPYVAPYTALLWLETTVQAGKKFKADGSIDEPLFDESMRFFEGLRDSYAKWITHNKIPLSTPTC